MSLLKKLAVRLSYLSWALERNPEPHLGDVVMYDGIRCSLIQGVSDPHWDLLPLTPENMESSKRVVFRHVHRDDFLLSQSLRRNLWALRSDYRFKMDYWYSIDVRRPFVFSHHLGGSISQS